MTKIAFLFPGQGSQYVGMAKDIFESSAEAKEMMAAADDILGVNLSGIMFNGSDDKLKQTEFTQPAIFLHSIVLAEIIKAISPSAAAGHSLGEYSALVSAGAIKFYDAVRLVKVRGKAMQQAGINNPGTMAAIVGLDRNIVRDCCNKAAVNGIVQCANFNSPGQVVISGSVEGVKKAMEICKSNGAKLVKELVVSGAFHSPLMQPAQDELKKAIDETPIFNSRFPVYTNVSAKAVTAKDEIADNLFRQLTSPVLWDEIITNMINDGIEEFIEIGPGKVLQGLVKRINPDIKCSGIDKYSEVEKYL